MLEKLKVTDKMLKTSNYVLNFAPVTKVATVATACLGGYLLVVEIRY